ncbi:hypothetical protein niasHT_022792 [Heterodera trifolii]|uniref:PIPK domain-containing protein n=1 Tax=Heterodera trifolii TaxID=157864 RepID=A0ABD2JWX5_9BILA
MIILSAKTLTLPFLLSIWLGIANAGKGDSKKGLSLEERCKKHEMEFKELEGEVVTEVLWEESLEKKADKEEEMKRLEEQEKTEKENEEKANANNVKWLTTLLGNYLCQKLWKKDGQQKQEQEVQKELNSETPNESVPLKQEVQKELNSETPNESVPLKQEVQKELNSETPKESVPLKQEVQKELNSETPNESVPLKQEVQKELNSETPNESVPLKQEVQKELNSETPNESVPLKQEVQKELNSETPKESVPLKQEVQKELNSETPNESVPLKQEVQKELNSETPKESVPLKQEQEVQKELNSETPKESVPLKQEVQKELNSETPKESVPLKQEVQKELNSETPKESVPLKQEVQKELNSETPNESVPLKQEVQKELNSETPKESVPLKQEVQKELNSETPKESVPLKQEVQKELNSETPNESVPLKQEVQKELNSETPKESVPDKIFDANIDVKADEKIFAKIRSKFGISDEELLMSLSELEPLSGRGGSGGVFYKTKDGKYILKNLNPDHDEPAKMAEMLDNYGAHVLDEENGQQPEEGKQSTDSLPRMNTFFIYFEMNVYAKLKEGKKDQRKKVLRLHKLQFVVLNNAFVGIDEQTLLKFDIKGTFAPGSALQHDQKQKWYTKKKDWPNSLYREYDFIGISREGREISAFFPEGIQLSVETYRQLADGVKSDATYLTENGVNDYSLLLGVQFMDPYPDTAKDRNDYKETKVGEKCVSAKCRNCKRWPDAKYEKKANLCLYMAIIDIVTPSNEKTEMHFLKIMQQKRADRADFIHYQSMSEFIPYHNEIVTPVPPGMYGKRFVGTVLGCLFSPESSTSVDGESERQFQLGMRQSICKTFGEKRGIKTNYGIEVFGLNMFKEMMEKREQSAWEMLNSFSDSLLPSQNQDEFVIEEIEDEQFFNFGSASNSNVSSPYFALFRNGKNYYSVVRNANAKKQKNESILIDESSLIAEGTLRRRKGKKDDEKTNNTSTPMKLD